MAGNTIVLEIFISDKVGKKPNNFNIKKMNIKESIKILNFFRIELILTTNSIVLSSSLRKISLLIKIVRKSKILFSIIFNIKTSGVKTIVMYKTNCYRLQINLNRSIPYWWNIAMMQTINKMIIMILKWIKICMSKKFFRSQTKLTIFGL